MGIENYSYVYVIFGGTTMEREGSILSACEVARALDKMNISNVMVEYSENIINFLIKENSLAFICMHGEHGEDGHMARLCEMNNIPYTFSSPDVHGVSFNKLSFKEFLKECNVKTPETVCDLLANKEFVLRTIRESKYSDFILKPVFGGGSLGVKYFNIYEDYEKIIFPLEEKYQPYFIESYIDGIFLTCVVSSNPDINGKLELLEVDFEGKIYDYHKKHSDERKYILPSNIDRDLSIEIKQNSQKLFQAGGYNGIVRFDFIVRDNEFFCLEVNTIPGLSKSGNAYTVWSHSGYSYEHLLDFIIKSAKDAKKEVMT